MYIVHVLIHTYILALGKLRHSTPPNPLSPPLGISFSSKINVAPNHERPI